MKKFAKIIFVVLIITLAIFGCAKNYDVSTSIGGFTMSADVASSFSEYTPESGNEFLIFNLTPASYDMTIDKMSDYFRPNDYNPGPGAIVSGTTYNLKYIAYSDGTPPSCILIYEVPSGTQDLKNITLELH